MTHHHFNVTPATLPTGKSKASFGPPLPTSLCHLPPLPPYVVFLPFYFFSQPKAGISHGCVRWGQLYHQRAMAIASKDHSSWLRNQWKKACIGIYVVQNKYAFHPSQKQINKYAFHYPLLFFSLTPCAIPLCVLQFDQAWSFKVTQSCALYLYE